MATSKKSSKGGGTSKKSTTKKQATKDPRGGLTAAGRRYFKEKEGANLKPGVTKKESEMTFEEMQRKGSFLRRHYANPRGPLTDDKGEPTRHALQAQAWGERVPKTDEDVKRLADKGTKLLEKAKGAKAAKQNASKSGAKGSIKSTKKAAKKSAAK